jgi:hypothetical protein
MEKKVKSKLKETPEVVIEKAPKVEVEKSPKAEEKSAEVLYPGNATRAYRS